MSRRYDQLAAWLLPRKRGAHLAVFLLTLLMIPGAMTALQPIDMESYEMESPELTAQTMINEEFPNSEIILGFLVSVRDPVHVPSVEDWGPVPEWPTVRRIMPPSFNRRRCCRPARRGAGLMLPRVAF